MPGFAERVAAARAARAAGGPSLTSSPETASVSRFAAAAVRAVENARHSSPEFRSLFGNVRPVPGADGGAAPGKASILWEAPARILPWHTPPSLEIQVDLAVAASEPGTAKGAVKVSRIAYGEEVLLGTTEWSASVSASSEEAMFDGIQKRLASFVADLGPQPEEIPAGPRR